MSSKEYLAIFAFTPGSFDLCLSAETLYRTSNFHVIREILVTRLSTMGAVSLHREIKCHECYQAFFAQKRFYFGVGGGSLPFLNYIRDDNALSGRIICSVEDGQSNVRDIIEIMKCRL